MKDAFTRLAGPAAVLLASLLLLPAVATTHAEAGDEAGALTEAARDRRSRLDFDGKVYSGAALKQLLSAVRDAQFLLIGEEHGIAGNPRLVA